MKLLLLMALPTLSSTSPTSEKEEEPVMLQDPSLVNVVPKITANRPANPAINAMTPAVLRPTPCHSNPSSSFKIDQTDLEWQTFDGFLPDGAVSIYNDYAGRTEYVAKYGSEGGHYNPGMGPYCHYPYCNKEYSNSPFEILVNKENKEFLVWTDVSSRYMPENSVITDTWHDLYVGKNQYGLGKIDCLAGGFYLPWGGYEYKYTGNYQVLTFDRDAVSEEIFDVTYKTDGVKPIKAPPQSLTKLVLINNDHHPVKQTAKLSKTVQTEQRWDFSGSLTVGSETTITAGIPLIASGEITISASITLGYSQGESHMKSERVEVNVEQEVPPNNSSTVHLMANEYTADIPFNASVKRTYRNGKTIITSITGTYKKVQYGEFRTVVDPCVPLPGAKHDH